MFLFDHAHYVASINILSVRNTKLKPFHIKYLRLGTTILTDSLNKI